MHWAIEKAKNIIENNEKDIYVCASGISPSGNVHIGNFREFITTYFVVKGLEKFNKKTRFIFSWDDFDRFRKVPSNISLEYEKFIGMPYSAVPSPYSENESYASYYEKEFENALRAFNINVEYIYQTKEYTSGRYNEKIAYALDNRHRIYDIINSFKTQDHSEEERENFYPISLYCNMCNKDLTNILNYDENSKNISYECKCGHKEIINVLNSNNMKLVWKVDWPMRWREENVVFEPGGRDHSAANGSFEVSTKIANEIFNFKAPEYVAYDFIGIKGSSGKMSSSKGNVITPSSLLEIYTPEIILYIFSKYRPEVAFNFAFDEDVIKHYTEFERTRIAYVENRLDTEDILYTSMEFSDLGRNIENFPSFSKVVSLLSILNFSRKELYEIFERNNEIYDVEAFNEICDKAENWLKNYNNHKIVSITKEPNIELLSNLSEVEVGYINKFLLELNTFDENDQDEFMRRVYEITRVENEKETKLNQKNFFNLIYRLILNSDRGPKISLLVKIVGVDKFKKLLNHKEESYES